MNKMPAKVPILIKTLLIHVISLAVIAGISLYLTTHNLIDPDSELSNMSLKFFWGIYFLGALVLGLGGIVQTAFLVGAQLWKKNDLNGKLVHEHIERLIFYAGEICISLAVLVISGFIKVFGLP